jgi:hypothetical protein
MAGKNLFRGKSFEKKTTKRRDGMGQKMMNFNFFRSRRLDEGKFQQKRGNLSRPVATKEIKDLEGVFAK